MISDYPDVTSLAHDVYFHIGHVQHDSTHCFHYMRLLYYGISNAFIIGTQFTVTIVRGSPACLGSQRGTHEKICVSKVIAPWPLYYFNYY